MCLQRPAHANRLEPEDLATLEELCRQLAGDSNVRVVILQSEGKHFSAGFDIRHILGISAEPAGALLNNPFEAVVEAFERLPQPTIARLHGGVYGGATDLALACDFRIGTPATEMFMPAAQLGVLYYPSGIRRFTERLGPRNAKEMFLLGERMDADSMLRIGYLNELVAAEQLASRIDQIAQRLCEQAPLALRGAKHAIDGFSRGDLDLEAFKKRETEALRSHDLKEGVAAWSEKRRPAFTGR